MTAGSCSSHPRRLVASVSWSDPSRDAGFLASIGGLSMAGTTPRSSAISAVSVLMAPRVFAFPSLRRCAN
jgi:hypothetical protein